MTVQQPGAIISVVRQIAARGSQSGVCHVGVLDALHSNERQRSDSMEPRRKAEKRQRGTRYRNERQINGPHLSVLYALYSGDHIHEDVEALHEDRPEARALGYRVVLQVGPAADRDARPA